MDFLDKVNTARGLDAVVRLDLGAQAEKIVCRLFTLYFKDKERFWSFAEVHKNFKTVSCEDARLILTELERCGMVITKSEKSRLWYKYNDDVTKFTNNSEFNTEKIIEIRKAYEEKLRKKIERARKFLRKVEQPKPPREKDCLDDFIQSEYGQTSPEITLQKTAKDLHDSKECDPLFCRFCAMEQNKEIGF